MVEFLKSINDKKFEILPSQSILKSKKLKSGQIWKTLMLNFKIAVCDLLQTLQVPICVENITYRVEYVING